MFRRTTSLALGRPLRVAPSSLRPYLLSASRPTRHSSPFTLTHRLLSDIVNDKPITPDVPPPSQPETPALDTTQAAPPVPDINEADRKHASFYVSNVFPIRLTKLDPRPALARLREETIIEELTAIVHDVKQYHFRLESLEVDQQGGGVFVHFSYVPPSIPELVPQDTDHFHAPEDQIVDPLSPAALFLPLFMEAANKHGGWPTWLGQWWAQLVSEKKDTQRVVNESGHIFYRGDALKHEDDNSPDLHGSEKIAGCGRTWVVRGRQWTEDLDRFASNRLRVEFDGGDVSQHVLYQLFRTYGRLVDIVPPTPVPAGSPRFSYITFSRVSPAITAQNCLQDFSTPTKTAHYDLRKVDPKADIPMTRLKIYYERQLNSHYIRDWISNHPRIALPILFFLIGSLSYALFDPIRAFFVRIQVEGVFDLEQYDAWRFVKTNVYTPIVTALWGKRRPTRAESLERRERLGIGRAAWRDRVEAETNIERWLDEYPTTAILVMGPPGSGKHDLVNHVIKHRGKSALIIDCLEMSRAKSDIALVNDFASETGYRPTFTFLQSINGLIDLASMGLIGQKAGFATPIEDQLRAMCEVVTTALKDVALHNHNQREKKRCHAEAEVLIAADREARMDRAKRGIWHDGRIDCIAGNGVMSELGLGQEELADSDLDVPEPPVMDGNAPIEGEGAPPKINIDTEKLIAAVESTPDAESDIDSESEIIKSLPIVVLRNFGNKPARGNLWTVLSEWTAGLVENKVAHVIVVCDQMAHAKSLQRALPSKPLNTVNLSDADDYNSFEFVREKLCGPAEEYQLGEDDRETISKLGGRMVDLELLVYKVRGGQSISEAMHDIVQRNVIELRKLAFGDDADDAKSLPWTRPQAWKIVTELSKASEASYQKLLHEFPFKGCEGQLKALEEHDLIQVVYEESRPRGIRPGKPVFRQAFDVLVRDDIFRAARQIEYNAAIVSKAESEIATYEEELGKLRDIMAEGDKLGAGGGGWLGLSKGSAIHQRAAQLLARMEERVKKVNATEEDSAKQLKVFSAPKA